jgi:sugar O-acyltransferase (sialic acid O-acetyltransferase NeuD family)
LTNRPSPRPRLVILGTSLFAREVTELAEEAGFEVVAFVENLDRGKTDDPFLGRPVVWLEDAAGLATDHMAVCSLGTTARKAYILRAAALGFHFATIVHPRARVSTSSRIGEGTVLSVGVILASAAEVGRHVILNRSVLVGHDTRIGDYVTLSPGANVAGVVTIGEQAYIGIGATIVDRITIGARATVGAGAVVIHDVPDDTRVMGNPARIVKA